MSDLLYEVRDQIAVLTINRPEKRNALSGSAIDLFLQRLSDAEADEAVHVVMITGAGDRAFCAGADLGGSFGADDAFSRYATLIKRLTHYPKPTVARVNGYCLAGGMGVMLACDLVIARDDSQFGTPEVNVGIFPMMIGALIFRNLHRKHAYELTLLGERIGVQQALEWGMINRAAAAAELDESVWQLCKKLAAKSPLGMRMGKRAFDEMQALSLDDAVDHLSQQLQAVLQTEDAAEGIRAFMEKRPPNFVGR